MLINGIPIVSEKIKRKLFEHFEIYPHLLKNPHLSTNPHLSKNTYGKSNHIDL